MCTVHSSTIDAELFSRVAPLSECVVCGVPSPAQNPENLLIFAAGNAGQSPFCTMGSPATAKNTLAVGATLSGSTRLDVEGHLYQGQGQADIDTVTFFSSVGPTLDGRIKPEVVAPGDMVR